MLVRKDRKNLQILGFDLLDGEDWGQPFGLNEKHSCKQICFLNSVLVQNRSYDRDLIYYCGSNELLSCRPSLSTILTSQTVSRHFYVFSIEIENKLSNK